MRIGVNAGSLDPEMLDALMDENGRLDDPLPADAVLREAMVQSAITSAEAAEEIGLPGDRIVLSCKTSRLQDMVAVYRDLAARCDYPLHLGLTEAGMGSKGIVSTTAALGILLQDGIGDTIRASLTPEPGGDRTIEVRVCRELLQSLGLRTFRPEVTACPGCGRTTSTVFQELAQSIERHLDARMARLARRAPRRRRPEGRRDGVHRERAGGEPRRRHRHQPARHRRVAARPGLRGRGEGRHRSRAPAWPTTSSGWSRTTSRPTTRGPGREWPSLVGAGDDGRKRAVEVVRHAPVGRLEAAHA